MDGQHDTFSGPAGFHTSQLDLNTVYKVSDQSRLWLGKTIKPVFYSRRYSTYIVQW